MCWTRSLAGRHAPRGTVCEEGMPCVCVWSGLAGCLCVKWACSVFVCEVGLQCVCVWSRLAGCLEWACCVLEMYCSCKARLWTRMLLWAKQVDVNSLACEIKCCYEQSRLTSACLSTPSSKQAVLIVYSICCECFWLTHCEQCWGAGHFPELGHVYGHMDCVILNCFVFDCVVSDCVSDIKISSSFLSVYACNNSITFPVAG